MVTLQTTPVLFGVNLTHRMDDGSEMDADHETEVLCHQIVLGGFEYAQRDSSSL